MPTKLKSRGNCWLARVVIDGQQVDSKVFPPGRSKGPEGMAAKTWEVERKKIFRAAGAAAEDPHGLRAALGMGRSLS